MTACTLFSPFRIRHGLAALTAAWIALGGLPVVQAAEAQGEFAKTVFDLGMVAKDPARTASFLTNAIGFKEVPGFPVSADLGRKIGLIDGHAVNVRVFVLEGPEPATRLKLLSFPDAPGQAPKQDYIHSTLGFRYLTLYVTDINRARARLERAGVPLLGETPLDLGGGTFIIVVRDPDGNFVELIGPAKN